MKTEGYKKSKFDQIRQELDDRMRMVLDTVQNK